MERRKQPRFQIEVAVVTPKAISFDATVTDISAGGVGLESTKSVSPGTKIAIFMKLQDEIELRGTVVWALDSHQKGKIMYQMGVQTDVIVFPQKKAYELSEKTGLVQEILNQIKNE